jgi:hypothetical protein
LGTVVEVPLGVVVSVDAVTVSVKLQVPTPPFVSVLEPLTAYEPTANVPVVVIAPAVETKTLDDPEVFVYVTAPVLPVEESVAL